MKTCFRVFLGFFLISLCAPIVPQSARAQWVSDTVTNTPVCVASSIQFNPQACSDGANGIIMVWEDLRSGGGSDIWAQRLDASGKPVWAKNGIIICTNSFEQRGPIIAADGAGGAYVVWKDSRTTANGIDLYGQHINADGSLSYGASGAGVATGLRDQTNAVITSDGFGNAYVAYEDNRATTAATRPDIYANYLTPSGVSWGVTGKPVTTQTGGQRGPAITDDGSGGCVVAWENGAKVPTAVFMQRLNSSGATQWVGANGIEIFKGDNPAKNSRDINIRRDGSEVMAAWEVTSPITSDGQDVFANRVRMDSTKVWYSPSEVTGEFFGDQTMPQVFSDDSTDGTNRGLLVVFQDKQGSQYDEDVAMVHALPDGASRRPTFSNGFYYIVHQANGQVGFQATPVESGSLMVAWNDARANTSDTSIYVQKVDRALRRNFPTTGTISTWGKPVSASTTIMEKQVVIVPRTNGAIIGWTDYRNGNADIYAQLVFKDGTLPIELSRFDVRSAGRGVVELAWKTAMERNNEGFAVQRRRIDVASEDNAYETIADFSSVSTLRGAGFSNSEKSYGYVDQGLEPGVYEYRIVDVDVSGTRTAHEAKHVDARFDANAAEWSIGVSHPNPVLDKTTLPISLAAASLLDIEIYDVTGRLVATPLQHQYMVRGEQEIALGLNAMQITSAGSYFVRATAYDPSTGAMIWHSSTPVLMQVVK